jgi:hypothetical protein
MLREVSVKRHDTRGDLFLQATFGLARFYDPKDRPTGERRVLDADHSRASAEVELAHRAGRHEGRRHRRHQSPQKAPTVVQHQRSKAQPRGT